MESRAQMGGEVHGTQAHHPLSNCLENLPPLVIHQPETDRKGTQPAQDIPAAAHLEVKTIK